MKIFDDNAEISGGGGTIVSAKTATDHHPYENMP